MSNIPTESTQNEFGFTEKDRVVNILIGDDACLAILREDGKYAPLPEKYVNEMLMDFIRTFNHYDEICKWVERKNSGEPVSFITRDELLRQIEPKAEDKPVFEPPPVEYTPVRKKQNCNLYLIHDTVANLLKIGRSKTPILRKQQLQCSTANKLELLFSINEVGHKEREIHKHFAHLNVGYEWFAYDQSIIDYFSELKHSAN